ncbi:MAG TPA: peptide chain release factor N(5)-glutamine methyltransferase [Abditibacterium sp.]|jgi:release factor glutamine methyltransferase
MNIKNFLGEATNFLVRNAQLERAEAHLQARLLLDDATGTRFCHLISPEAILEASQLEKLQRNLEDAARGRPIPYILGHAPFFGLNFEVAEAVLIPRPETELLVETVLEKLKNRQNAKIADLGTGSGAIAVTLAKMRPDFAVWALDISPGALQIAGRNARTHSVSVEWIAGSGDWLAPLEPFAPFNAIISNPPYIAAQEIETLDVGVREFEPRLALDGGADGLDPYREIASGARKLMTHDGFLAMEIGAGQWHDIHAIFTQSGFDVESPRLDLAGIERVLVAN